MAEHRHSANDDDDNSHASPAGSSAQSEGAVVAADDKENYNKIVAPPSEHRKIRIRQLEAFGIAVAVIESISATAARAATCSDVTSRIPFLMRMLV